MNTTDLIDALTFAESYMKNTLGYDTVDAENIILYPDGKFTFVLTHLDDFQIRLPSYVKYHHEAYHSFGPYTSIYQFYEDIYQIPSRERRELQVMARKYSSLLADDEQLMSLAAQEWAAKIRQEAQELFALLEGPKPANLDDEIPF